MGIDERGKHRLQFRHSGNQLNSLRIKDNLCTFATLEDGDFLNQEAYFLTVSFFLEHEHSYCFAQSLFPIWTETMSDSFARLSTRHCDLFRYQHLKQVAENQTVVAKPYVTLGMATSG